MSKRPHDQTPGGGGARKQQRGGGFKLTSLLNAQSETNRSTSTARSHMNAMGTSTPGSSARPILHEATLMGPDRAIAEFIDNCRETIEQRGTGGNIEVESRLGTITSQSTSLRFQPPLGSGHNSPHAVSLSEDQMRQYDAKFVAGVCLKAYNEYSKSSLRLSETDKFTTIRERSIVSSFAQSKRVIEELDVDTRESIKAPYLQVKQKLGVLNIFLPHCPYDVRVAVSCEFPNQPLPSGLAGMQSSPESTRRKDRTSIVGRELRIDLTEVEDNLLPEPLYEVEVELKNASIQSWLKGTAIGSGDSLKATSEFGASIWNVVKRFIPDAGQAFKRKVPFAGSTEVANAYRSIVSHKWSSDKFPGTMPVGFARWHIPCIKGKKYWVSEKTDGVRYYLVVAGGTASLVDRTNAHFTTSGLELLSTVFPDGTVLDGEFVKHQRDGKYIFMVFDILATGSFPSCNHVDKSFEERLVILNDFLSENGPYGRALNGGHVQPSSVLTVLRKRWIPLSQISSVFGCITKVKIGKTGSIARIYKDNKREHFTDGIVFCPNSKYTCGSHNEYLKWKWSDLITIDFLAESTNDTKSGVTLSCGGPRNSDIPLDSLITIDPRDLPIVKKLLEKVSGRSAIIEFGFTAETGQWNYKGHRPDKDRANYVMTVLGSLLNIAEGISEEELQYRITKSVDDWGEKSKHMRRELLYKQQNKN